MVIVLHPSATQAQIEELKAEVEKEACSIWPIQGKFILVFGVVGDTGRLDRDRLLNKTYVDKVLSVQEPYKKANRMFHPENTVISIEGAEVGGERLAVIAGPCSVESEAQIVGIARQVKESGATLLRGGAFKPRTSPYSFQGMREEGLELLKIARQETGLPIVSELMSIQMLEQFVETVDVIQIGARNMQNFDLLKEVGKTSKPVLLKRGLSATIEELLMSAEYIMAEGNENVILCERGIRTFETYTRNTLDLSAVLALKRLSHLPVVVDPSHAAGMWWMVEALSKAAIAVGADGVMIEVHNDPTNAKCDGAQSIKPERFAVLMQSLRELARIERRVI
ncbi:3-deoxy-7-phosphoheptulonate synthase [Anaerosporomusa subterranea]|uniref:3-deoxy-7-phosphoheptulonate synthase n=1 Tax=Anaerosporomusa subterranea TaxID=1794912 RepID=A0A154BVE2_ANASB|nr:3-deoxy-7-phosphoheptulonate synthase [Anaerosporomusa subterranea]KYZ77877.1 3-deoxy-7-phosphoheptulonate synthase [Anaerosporomusa subterranea]